ncbi:PolC-type DNA polymerase III [Limosilactobacillus sp. RRLNB_1_1]|uniref:DNA polymerase III PolC-type n=1 Tax=Limosilactobacillus albertensis TaxID=2759752 RepID=A0A7W3TQY3_9LACO|nr:PolC-type DNA polymerase III [Limosilactobacillus albertensis]MBB1069244.1 PolC-type DNA polymerase III [Limosilactobacillus albertensis]MCD7118458.1 PolC-type DNA polymerase III [Limosilactobacillus albertensis]MCD7128601.1 PolC-type DNA polymerase III [Limosilactobacillus albertensis]
MGLSRQELFGKLLEQIHFPEKDNSAFRNAAVQSVVVHKKSRHWEFHLIFNKALPYDLFTQFNQSLELGFKDIAKVSLKISTPMTELDGAQIANYWQFIINHAVSDSPMLQQACLQTAPEVKDGRVTLVVENELIKDLLAQKALDTIENSYQELGFPKFRIHPFVDQSASQAKIEELKAKHEKADAALAAKAAARIKKNEATKATKKSAPVAPADGPVQLGRLIDSKQNIVQMKDIEGEERSVVVEGYVFNAEIRELRSGRQLLTFEITDYTSSFAVKKFSRNSDEEAQFANIKAGMWLKVRGPVQEDTWMRDLVITAYDVNEVTHTERQDQAPKDEKRVELHTHTTMSQMDATNSITELATRAHKWGHPAIAVTDHGNVQAFPEAFSVAQKTGIKMIYGMEANVVDDGIPLVYNENHQSLAHQTYVIFDVETTGLSAIYDKVIELSAVKMQDGNVLERFDEFIDPGFPLSEQTTNLTSITTEMVQGSKTEEEVFKMFKDFCKGSIIAGHNVSFDMGFMNTGYERHQMERITEPVIDTLPLARFLYPDMRGYRLNTLSKKFKVALEHHHRANYDSEATGHLLYKFLKDAEARYDVKYVDDLNKHMEENNAYRHARPFHVTIFAQTQAGLKNLFKLVSLSNVEYFYRVPRIPRTVLTKYREGLLLGTACSSGEVFTAMMEKGYSQALEKARYYDFIEIQPKPNYAPLLEQQVIADEAHLEDILKNMVKLGDELDKTVVATGDVHYLDPHDGIYRKILINSQGGANPLNRTERPDVHFRTTDEMLKEFSFLGEEKAHEVVVENSNKIADEIDDNIRPVKDKLYPPHMKGAEQEIQDRTWNTARKWYGDPLPQLVQDRIELELNSIVKNGFSVHYLIAQRLVAKSNKDGYLVGSRGSVGSSVVATLSGITEVNPLPPHYRCPNCQFTHFYTQGEYSSGFDLPDKKCPKCGTLMVKDGHDIPFQTFLGFKGNKVPDIDLNFSGDYQPIAHNYMKVLFGEKNVFRAGTIGTVADKTAYGYVKAYERDTEKEFRKAEEDRLAKGATGVKRTTGQHPAGIIIVPDDMDIYDFTPVQYPADDQTAAWETTHFDFHSIHDNILKMDILGHDDPTMIRALQDLSGIDPQSIPMDDPGVMALFSSPKVLGVTEEQIQSKTGTLGLPEFGTRFVRGMLEDTHPKNYSQLLQISGLSHGTGVWLDNAQELIRQGIATIANVIGCRDNIMTDLIHYGMDSEIAFQIMEHVRKGRGIPDEWQTKMHEANVPQWYMDSCLKIKYMFPRAHAAAYVLMALRIAYFKVYFPLVYYCAFFSVRADDFDVVAMSHGKDAVKQRMKEINDKGNDASAKEKNLLTILELANEMLERGFKFKMVDIEKSDASDWLIDGDSLIAPFRAVPGLGLNVAKQIVAAREERPFLSKEDLAERGKVSQTLIDFLTDNHVLDKLPDENQLSLF